MLFLPSAAAELFDGSNFSSDVFYGILIVIGCIWLLSMVVWCMAMVVEASKGRCDLFVPPRTPDTNNYNNHLTTIQHRQPTAYQGISFDDNNNSDDRMNANLQCHQQPIANNAHVVLTATNAVATNNGLDSFSIDF